MALNQAHYNGGVLIHSGEWIILYCDGVELTFEGSGEAAMKGKKKGRLYLTSHRVIFTSKESKDALQSFSMPFTSLGSVDIDQPIFGANAIKGFVKALPQGNWTGQSQFRLTFSHGGAIEFGQAMICAAKAASRNPPPPYAPPVYTSNNFYQPSPQQYMAEQQNVGGYVPPPDKFPSAPPAQDVWMTDQPPPYSSIYPQIPQQNFPAPAAGYAAAYPPTGYPQQTNYQGYPPAGAYNYNGSYGGAPPPYQEKEKHQ